MEEGFILDPLSGTQGAPAEKPSTRRKAVRRRDPDKRRMQNRMAQKTYSKYYGGLFLKSVTKRELTTAIGRFSGIGA